MPQDTGKSYSTQCTGAALETVLKHSDPQSITLFGGSFCPFVHRVWIAFEFLEIPYKYYEVDPYKKPQELLDVSPRGLVPGLRLENFNPPRALNESLVILEYLEDLSTKTLFPPTSNPYARALVRLQVDYISTTITSTFYHFLHAQTAEDQAVHGKAYSDSLDGLAKLFDRAETEILGRGGVTGEGERKYLASGLGLWIEGNEDLNFTDVVVGPWLFRSSNVLKYYRNFSFPTSKKWTAYLEKLFKHPSFARTCSTDQLYIDSYEMYAFNRPLGVNKMVKD